MCATNRRPCFRGGKQKLMARRRCRRAANNIYLFRPLCGFCSICIVHQSDIVDGGDLMLGHLVASRGGKLASLCVCNDFNHDQKPAVCPFELSPVKRAASGQPSGEDAG